jgi:hypothetical protein
MPNTPLFHRKRKKPDGELDEVTIGSPAVTLVVLVVIALLMAGLLLLGVDPSALLPVARQVTGTVP